MVRLADNDPDLTEQIQKLMQRLREARTQPNVQLAFRDGRRLVGAITFVERLGTGRLINVEEEFALDFNIYDLETVDFP
ncbi:MAG: hypothetical protein DWQ01_20595 [Planctomycetota bacterium]|nr:MAG: hypothetical protein DWQ01_20595 [Planctomycetota bacterium]